MEHEIYYQTFVIVIVTMMGFTLGLKWLMTRVHTPKRYKEQLTDQDEIIKGLKTQIKQWKGKFHARNNPPTVSNEIQESEDLEKILPDLAQNYAPHAPNWLKPLLQDPEIIKWAVGLAKEHPEQAKNWLGKFVRKQSEKTNALEKDVSGL